ncbi:hypothetical protein [Synechocystis sp. PCC 6714]|uniref:hypothetical protein n=1 Tax=unclassified Synechocystis TaxID=2640012 RepID=UPI000405C4A4|nr:hypothetical protein [Synechocystis sp. PCC 6714]AIE74586.1 hypothetical protein D082_20580 [Synechocystis sp. PCC 6714]MCT0254050.1 hypothetical protein [Synechocystis sp. CS-94]
MRNSATADFIKNCHFKLARQLCDQGDSVFVEDLDFPFMAKEVLSNHTLDTGLEQFINQILFLGLFSKGGILQQDRSQGD